MYGAYYLLSERYYKFESFITDGIASIDNMFVKMFFYRYTRVTTNCFMGQYCVPLIMSVTLFAGYGRNTGFKFNVGDTSA